MKRLNVLMLLLISLTACSMSMIKSNDDAYLKSKTVNTLQAPQGVSAQNFGEDYPVPNNIAAGNSTVPSEVPPGSMSASSK
jgi:uncharacterized lipoprotein